MIYNLVAQNSITQREIKVKLQEAELKNISVSTLCRKLKKIGLTKKRISFIPVERNSSKNHLWPRMH
jgi:arginine repressor